MRGTPQDLPAFVETVVERLRQLRPGYEVELLGPRELLVNGRRLDLENLFRIVTHQPSRHAELVEQFLEQLFSGETIDLAEVSFDFARPRVMPRIQPTSIFDHLDKAEVAHVPFVNDSVVVFVIDLPHMTVSITREQMVRWGINAEDLDSIARTNLGEYEPQLDLTVMTSPDGGRAVVVSEQDGYDAARLLLDDLYTRLSARLGGDFYVATPARDMLIAFSTGPAAFVSRLCRRIAEDYERLPYPISPELFYVTRDGVAGRVAREDLGLAA